MGVASVAMRFLHRVLGIWSPSRTAHEGRLVTRFGDPIKTRISLARLYAALDLKGNAKAVQDGMRKGRAIERAGKRGSAMTTEALRAPGEITRFGWRPYPALWPTTQVYLVEWRYVADDGRVFALQAQIPEEEWKAVSDLHAEPADAVEPTLIKAVNTAYERGSLGVALGHLPAGTIYEMGAPVRIKAPDSEFHGERGYVSSFEREHFVAVTFPGWDEDAVMPVMRVFPPEQVERYPEAPA